MRLYDVARWLSLGSITAALAATALADTSPPIQVQLRSPWPAAPLLLEILEAAHEEEPSSFFTLLTHLTSPWAFSGVIKGEQLDSNEAGSALQRASEEQIHRAAKRILQERQLLQDRGQEENFELALALRSQSPKIAAFWQLYDTNRLHQRWELESRGRECGSWVDFAGKVLCSKEELCDALESYDGLPTTIAPALVPFDHLFSSAASEHTSNPTAVLYADPFSSNFWSLHKYLTEYALGSRRGEDALRYVLRWKPMSAHTNDSYLAGYGAALDLKKVDYLVIDDRKLTDTAVVQSGHEGEPSLPDDSKKVHEDQMWMEKQLKTSKEDRTKSLGSLEERELEDVGVKAAYVIAKSKQPLRALRQLSQDFPRHAVALARSAAKPSKSFAKEMLELHSVQIQAGGEEVWLNGKSLTGKDFQPLGLLSILRYERAIINSLTALNLTSSQAVDLLTSPAIAKAYSSDDSSAPFFDASDRIERDASKESSARGAIVYWNDIEREGDRRYARWSAELGSLLRPMYPGSFPIIRRNLFNIIVVMDLARTETCRFLSESVHVATSRMALRWGLVPSNIQDPSSPSALLARYFWLVFDQAGVDMAAKYLRRLALASEKDETVDVSTARLEVEKILNLDGDEIDELLGQYTQRETQTRAYLQRLRGDDAERGLVFVNGQVVPFVSQFFQLLHQTIAVQVQMLAPLIFYGHLSEDVDLAHYFYDLPQTHASRSELVFPSADSEIKTRAVAVSRSMLAKTSVFHSSHPLPNLTVWLAGDLDSQRGAKMIKDVVDSITNASARLALVHIPRPSSSTQPSLLLSTFLHQFLTSSSAPLVSQLSEVLEGYEAERDNLHSVHVEGQTVLGDAASSINDIKAQGWAAPDAAEAARYWGEGKEVQEVMGLAADDFAIVINGRLVSGFDPDRLTRADYLALLQSEASKADTVVAELAKTATVDADVATLVAAITSKAFIQDTSQEGLFGGASPARSALFDRITTKECSFEVGNRQTASLRFSILIDPISETAQMWSSVLDMLSQFDDVYIKVILNPQGMIKELPIKRYYRYSAPHQLTFDPEGQTKSEVLRFKDMPMDAVLTMGLDAPPSWLTMAAEALYDLDNIRLTDVVTPVVSAVYELKYILIEGHARDQVTKTTPRGLQLVLETMDGSQQLDTIVMANLAYFQFRARPGLYRLRIREGRSTHLFDMVSVGNAGFDSPRVEVTGDAITLSTLQGLTIYPRLAKKAGMEKEILVEEEGKAGAEGAGGDGAGEGEGVGAAVLSLAKDILQSVTAKKTAVAEQEQSVINVFTVASGHLYERMTYIMILSVLRHTNSSVKFWFIENFLSPSFKDFIPHLANEYGFQYELITYAWPHWLHAQKEKQRSIWGMKVLFLDVIFPLNLTKVIFVDADQIVRADLKELIDTDLKGAPYGFPPMGNDSFDMDNFRFWEQPGGYWQKFLQGKPYPISALFVIDLNTFRLQAAGDKLRGHYQALSQDPGSLSNLDQDLVASMIHVVNIHNLGKEWLWCETWCSWDWYEEAKSIDLCSNPKTKEPKLDRAKRQIPEWTEYDEEVARAAIKFKQQGKLGANVVAPKEKPETGSGDKGEGRATHGHDEL